jgi:hypothetical protein
VARGYLEVSLLSGRYLLGLEGLRRNSIGIPDESAVSLAARLPAKEANHDYLSSFLSYETGNPIRSCLVLPRSKWSTNHSSWFSSSVYIHQLISWLLQ